MFWSSNASLEFSLGFIGLLQFKNKELDKQTNFFCYILFITIWLYCALMYYVLYEILK